jgi:O-antigen/teichoic acid export membrane protein
LRRFEKLQPRHQSSVTPAEQKSQPVSDVSGRQHMVRNVLVSWLSQLVFIVAGFVMPRLIDHQLGQEMLGLWDFGWTIVAYFSLVQMGVVGSINRYVATHQATGDIVGVNRCVSSIFLVLLAMAGLMVLLSIGTAFALPHLLDKHLSQFQNELAWVVLGLGLATAVQTASAVYSGVLTGCHQWGIHNGLYAGGHVVTVAGMIGVLLAGGGLRGLAIVQLLGELLPAAARMYFAYRVCPGLSLSPRHADAKTARSMMQFGSKSFVPQIADLLLNQTVNVLIVASLGPAALALFARPRSLVLQTRSLIFKMSAVLVPSVSSLQALGDHRKIQDLVIKATRYACCLTLPVTVVLVTMGSPVLVAWMGPDYKNGIVLALLAFGYTTYIVQGPTIGILGGMNLHGRPAIMHLIACAISALLVAAALLVFQLDLPWVAAAVCGPLALLNAIYVPLYVCRQLKLSGRDYFWKALAEPVFYMVPATVILLLVRWWLWSQPLLALPVGIAIAAMITIPIYWRWVLPESMKKKIRARFAFGSAPRAAKIVS